MRWLWGLGLVAMACTTDGGGMSTAGSTGTGPTGTPGSGSATPADGASTGSGNGAGVDTIDSQTTTTGSAEVAVADCRALLERAPGTPDGVYSINAGGDLEGPSYDVYCDMTTEGGGWTLVARSAVGKWVDVPFGWQQATGSVDDDTMPYSVDALGAQLEFSEALLGSYSEGKAWGSDVYLVDMPEHFVFVYGQAPHSITPTTVIGSCMPREVPHHLSTMGWTEQFGVYYMNSYSTASADGLEPGGWDTDHEDCESGGNLHTLQGMIMVR